MARSHGKSIHRRDTCNLQLIFNNVSLLSHQEWVEYFPYMSVTDSGYYIRVDGVDGTFAIMTVVLPCKFTGGTVRISHAGESVELTSWSSKITKTTTLAWYTGVTYEAEPITEGHCLTLSYRLRHIGSSLRPALTHGTEFTKRIRPILKSYMQTNSDSKSGPEKIVCRLNGKYKEDLPLSLKALKGGDARLVKLIQSMASEVGLHIGLGMAKLEGSGYCRHECNSENEGGCDDPSESEMTMGSNAEFSAEVQNLVGLDGGVICEKLEFVDEEETVPEYFEDEIRLGKPAEQCVDFYDDVRDLNLILALLYLLKVWIVHQPQ